MQSRFVTVKHVIIKRVLIVGYIIVLPL